MIETIILDAKLGIVVAAPYTDRVVILGKGPTARRVSLRGDEEVWHMNTGGMRAALDDAGGVHMLVRGRRVEVDPSWIGHRLMQIHDRRVLSEVEEAWLKLCPVPIYTRRVERDLPLSVRYPLEMVRDTFGGDVPLSSSFDYALALALAEGFRHITLAGVDLQRGTWRERLVEHPAHAFWRGVARGRGVTVKNYSFALHAPFPYGTAYFQEAQWGRREIANALLGNANLHDYDVNPKALRKLLRLW